MAPDRPLSGAIFLTFSADFLGFPVCSGTVRPYSRGSRSESRKGADAVNKNELIQKLADTTGLDKNASAKAVDGVFDLIAATLKAGEEVRLTGFGVFVVASRAGGKGRNPQTGEEITIKPSKQPRFRAGKHLKDMLN